MSRFGEATWSETRAKAGVDDPSFVTMLKYPDEVTYRLVGAASEVLGAPAEAVLEQFGEHWTVYSAEAGFGHLLQFDPAVESGEGRRAALGEAGYARRRRSLRRQVSTAQTEPRRV